MHRLVALLSLVTCLACSSSLAAQTYEAFSLAPSDLSSFDEFGFDLAVDGDVLVIGAPGTDGTILSREFSSADFEETDSSEAGAVYIFTRQGEQWSLTRTFRPASSEEFETPRPRVGHAVVVQGSLVVVASLNDTGTAAGDSYEKLFVFEQNQDGPNMWGQIATVDLSFQSQFEKGDFAKSIALDQGRILLGDMATNFGRGRVFLREQDEGGTHAWGTSVELDAPTTDRGTGFGKAVDLQSTTIAVGAPQGLLPGAMDRVEIGAAHIYRQTNIANNTWTLQQTLQPVELEEGDQFGARIALQGDTLVISAPGDDGSDPMSPISDGGALYVFQRIDGMFEQATVLRLAAPRAAQGLGQRLALSTDRLLVLDRSLLVVEPPSLNRIHLFERDPQNATSWGLLRRFEPLTPARTGFGGGLDFDGEVVLGAEPEGESSSLGIPAGVVYGFDGISLVLTSPQEGQTLLTDPPSFQGISSPGASVTIELDGSSVGMVTAEMSGGFEYRPPMTLGEGEHTLVARAMLDMETSQPRIRTFLIDAQPPTVTLLEPEDDGFVTSTDVVFEGTTDSAVNSLSLEVLDDQQEVAFTAQPTASPQGDWSATWQDAPEGNFTITVTATDTMSRQTASPMSTFTVDRTPPQLESLSLQDGQTLATNLPEVLGEFDELCSIRLDAGLGSSEAIQTDEMGRWSWTPSEPLPEGERTFTLVATDEAGNQSEPISRSVVIPRSIPLTVRVIEDPDQDGIVDGPTITLEGTAPGTSVLQVWLDDEMLDTTEADALGDWNLALQRDFEPGIYELQVVAPPLAETSSPRLSL